MKESYPLNSVYKTESKHKRSNLKRLMLHIDPFLLAGLIILTVVGLLILYSASNESLIMVEKQIGRLLLAFTLMLVFAHIPPRYYQQWTPWFFGAALLLLFIVLIIGTADQGARRWIVFGAIRFQPSEIMKLALPMMLAWFLEKKTLPPTLSSLAICSLILILPVLLTAKQPDLGTAIIISIAGLSVLLFAGIDWKLVAASVCLFILSIPILWHFMHFYQKERVFTFLNPERDPLGSGYHIIQSKIAIGSGGLFGRGWLHGTQSHLSFLPAHATDFIYAVSAEEWGLLGSLFIISLFLALFARCLYMSIEAQNSFCRLLSGSLSLTFILPALINIGMVMGLLPVVGIPLPLISYGGSSMLITMISFGIIMSIHSHKKLYSS